MLFTRGKNFLADTLSRMPQYNSTKAEIIKPLFPLHQLAAQMITRLQRREKQPMDNANAEDFNKALERDELFSSNKNVCSVQDRLAWVGRKLYVPTSQRLKTMQICHDCKLVGHCVSSKDSSVGPLSKKTLRVTFTAVQCAQQRIGGKGKHQGFFKL